MSDPYRAPHVPKTEVRLVHVWSSHAPETAFKDAQKALQALMQDGFAVEAHSASDGFFVWTLVRRTP